MSLRVKPGFQSKNQVTEVRSLTGLRGLAAIHVVLTHFYQPLYMTSPPRTFLAHGYLAVDLFFGLSGFVMALNYSNMFAQGATVTNVRIFLGRRFSRIYPIYLFALLLTVFLLEDNGHWLSAEFWANVFLVQNWGPWYSLNGPSWSISTEWLAYVLFPLLVSLFLFRTIRLVSLLSGFCIACLIFAFRFGTGSDLWHGPLSLVRCVCEFSLGLTAYRLLSTRLGQNILRKPWYAELLSAAALALLCFRGTDVVFAILCPVLLLSLAGPPNLVTRFLSCSPVEWLGLLSFSIYLLHMLVYRRLLWPMDAYLHRAGHAHAHTYATLICLMLLFPAAAVTYYGIEVPARRWLRTLLEGRPVRSLVPA